MATFAWPCPQFWGNHAHDERGHGTQHVTNVQDAICVYFPSSLLHFSSSDWKRFLSKSAGSGLSILAINSS